MSSDVEGRGSSRAARRSRARSYGTTCPRTAQAVGASATSLRCQARQDAAGVPPSANPGGHVGRGVPDVAGDADPQTGYMIRVDGKQAPIGGTSAVAPLWTGLLALVNQKLGKAVGYLNPLIYDSAKFADTGTFRDIVTGNNGAYDAGPGWDACTGLGSPEGTKLLAALRQSGGQRKGGKRKRRGAPLDQFPSSLAPRSSSPLAARPTYKHDVRAANRRGWRCACTVLFPVGYRATYLQSLLIVQPYIVCLVGDPLDCTIRQISDDVLEGVVQTSTLPQTPGRHPRCVGRPRKWGDRRKESPARTSHPFQGISTIRRSPP